MSAATTRLQGQTALVTGASRGIGRAIALRLAADGARVIGTATTEGGASAITEALAAQGGEGRVLDVRDAAACTALVEAVGPLSILVNNAGVTRDTLLMRMKDEDWSEVLDTDLTSVFRLSRAVMRGMMKARYGRIVSIGSVVGQMGNPGQANYCAAKAGLVGFSKSLAQEVGSRGITVNVVAPGFIETDMTHALGDETRKALLERVPAQRLGSPEDIAAAVAYLASPEAGYVSGETLHVNGGMYMS
ncbi:3-oxoacyl-ACP reductase FabG [Sinimarinibacterium sp. CAU 1509]|uniref:3-oxoacyl-ACP reductase FabG n=1 Tax=Sinimarinibacterium sp. CAU 1509 TaxID=2562283 RepID=UPI0010AC5746|nr:3-oxoacyl-ACP reductase FabG [Sinimarinibacterium sp. CAU 1509]TJY55773.1 3-oxoacyl-ACP reductase FabG [Sinimarinibacterium sp. CAU 1509]